MASVFWFFKIIIMILNDISSLFQLKKLSNNRLWWKETEMYLPTLVVPLPLTLAQRLSVTPQSELQS